MGIKDNLRHVVVRNDGMYAADISRTRGASYTNVLENAKIHPNLREAQRDCCGNEHPQCLVDVYDRMTRR